MTGGSSEADDRSLQTTGGQGWYTMCCSRSHTVLLILPAAHRPQLRLAYCTINRRHFHISHCILQIHAERFVKSHKQRHVSDDLNKIKVAVECHQGRVSARIKDGTCGWRLHYAGLYLGLWI